MVFYVNEDKPDTLRQCTRTKAPAASPRLSRRRTVDGTALSAPKSRRCA